MARLTASLPAGIMFLVALGLAWLAMQPPSVVPSSAAPTAFSAMRAMSIVRAASLRPHPAGSPEAARVRRVVAARLRLMGARVFALNGIGVGVSSGKNASVQAGEIETLVAILPGRMPELPAVAMMAHTDSVPGSFGAADDGVGVAVVLETARAVLAGGRPERDVVLILTDGEEAGLLGARLFFADPARARRIGALINIDSRGTRGLGTMFETGPGSGGLVAKYRATADHRFAHSAATFLYRQLPNRTDLTATAKLDIPALNFAFLDGEFDYHTPRDAFENVDPRTVQSLGDQVLPVVRAVADDPRPLLRGGDGVFADAWPVVSVRYPAWAGWPLLATAIGLAGLGMIRGGVGATAVMRGAAAALACTIVTIVTARLGYALTGVADDWGAHHRIMATFGRYEVALCLVAASSLAGAASLLRRGRSGRAIALGCLVATAVAIVLGRPPLATGVLGVAAAVASWWAFAEPIEQRAVRAGSLLVGLILALTVQSLAPALTPLILFPTLAAAGATVAVRFARHGAWIAAALGVLPLAYLFIFGHSVLLALGVPTPEAIGVFVLFATPIVLPLAGGAPLRFTFAALLTAAALLLSIRATPASPRYPALSQLYGVSDPEGRRWLVSPLERPDPWTMAMLRRDGAVPAKVSMPLVADDPVWRVPARDYAVPSPTIRIARESEWRRIIVTPGSSGRTMTLSLAADTPLQSLVIGERAVSVPGMDRTRVKVRWQSTGKPVVLRYRSRRGSYLQVVAAETTEDRLSLPSRPATVVGWLGSDRIIAMRTASSRE
ncbi:M28 family peptidase [Sphingomonas rubra]|uniref:M28 family peptidase n=1 Tax=Sphingomonas rubra TaxID=634430 RepID=UPI0015A4F504|nr:M28 family peptidase [Sphingomonas rubra]